MSEPLSPVPKNCAKATSILEQAFIPQDILKVAQTLSGAGHAAVLVGGAIRDMLLGRAQGDWDLASSATPQEVMALFKRCIPTGVQHGTVTVLVGHGKDVHQVEVTTFRGEGSYEDGRRPSEVVFLRDLEEDLARRDFTINAFAWDPIARHFTDCFCGLEDLEKGQIRAVGVPLERFREDGLRTMRAVRFAATLDFELEAETLAAIPQALDVFEQVSGERVRVELIKLLSAERPGKGIRALIDTGLWGRIRDRDGKWEHPGKALEDALDALDRLPPDPWLRLARLLMVAGDRYLDAGDVVERLRGSRKERKKMLAWMSEAGRELVGATEGPEIRKTAATLGREHLAGVLQLYAVSSERSATIMKACEGAPLGMDELRIGGKDLLQEGLVKPGPQLGFVLKGLWRAALENPACNQREKLLELAKQELDGTS